MMISQYNDTSKKNDDREFPVFLSSPAMFPCHDIFSNFLISFNHPFVLKMYIYVKKMIINTLKFKIN